MKNIRSKSRTKKRAFITGISGQDGSYLAEFLLKKGYEVYGLNKDSEPDLLKNFDLKTKSKIKFFKIDITDTNLIKKILREVRPDEIYNLAAISDITTSLKNPRLTLEVNFKAPQRLLEETLKILPDTKVFCASSAEIFDKSKHTKNKYNFLNPKAKTTNPYAMAKLRLHESVLKYRTKSLFVCSGFLFNHESPRRKENFVTRKITHGLSRIKLDLDNTLYLGNIDVKRDWGYAGDYVEGMWSMLQQKHADDYILATNKPHTVREFVEESAKVLGMNIVWKGKGVDEKGIDTKTGKVIVEIDPAYFRPIEINVLVGDNTKAKKDLGWKPKVTFKELVKIMTLADLEKEKEM